MGGSFGRSPLGMLVRPRGAAVGAADLRQAAVEISRALPAGVRLDVVDTRRAGTVLVLEEDERRSVADAADLADEMTRAGVPATPAGVSAALTAWIARRPVTDAAAATAGVAVLDWTDASRSAVGWRVVVSRDGVVLPWSPSPVADACTIERTRAAARERSAGCTVDLRMEGPVALWAHPATPRLASAVLVAPEQMRKRAAAAGLRTRDVHVVVTPARPVVTADAGIAARLAAEAGEPCVTLPWQSLADLPWI